MNKVFLCLGLSILCGCSVSPVVPVSREVARLSADIPGQWSGQTEVVTGNFAGQWWQDFGVSALNTLIEQALQDNPALAASRLAREKAQLGIKNSAEKIAPQVNGSLNSNLGTTRQNTAVRQSYSAAFGISYLVDLWGKLGLEKDNNIQEAKASAQDVLAEQLSVIGAVINRYLQLAYIQGQLQLNQHNLDYAKKNRDFAAVKYRAGSVAKLELLQAEQAINALQSTRNRLQSEYKRQQSALALILGQAAPVTVEVKNIDDITVPAIDAGIPVRLLAQRPDLRAAQYRLQQSLNNVAIAERDFYPDLTLGGNSGISAERLGQLLHNPSLALSAALNLPFLHYQEKVLAQQQAKLNYQQALANFRQKLYTALSETQQALVSLAEARQENQLATERLRQSKATEALNQVQYAAGAISLQTLLSKVQERRNSEEALLNSRYQLLLRSVALHLALGGMVEENPPAAPVVGS